jgi:hypothetical protein
VKVGSVANILEVHGASIFRVQVNRVYISFLLSLSLSFLVYKNSVSKFLNFYNNFIST